MRRGVAALLIASLLGLSGVATAQPPTKIARIGVLSGSVASNDACIERFRRGMTELGWVEGKSYTIEIRWTEGKSELLQSRAEELIELKVDLILTYGGGDVTQATARNASRAVPVVLATSVYLAESGIVASLSRPGGNVTGISTFWPELMAKRVQLLKEAVPTATRIAIIRVQGRTNDLIVKDLEATARSLGVQAHAIEVRRPDDLPAAFATAVRGGARAVMTTQGPFFAVNRQQLADLALKHKLPSLSGEQAAPEAGTLLFYGPYVYEGCQRAATFADRILKGAKAGDLPIELPTKVELVVNLKTARALGLTIPPSVLARADRVIE